MSWSSLPGDIVDLILAELSLVELARISPVCTSFQALYRERVAVHQKPRLDLAISLCGRERIACIVALVSHLLLGRPLRCDVYGLGKISADGVLHWRRPSPVDTIERGDFWLSFHRKMSVLYFNFPPVKARGMSRLGAIIIRKGIIINVCPNHDEDLQQVAMVQAMLSEGLAQFLHHTGKWAEINIWPWADDVTAAGLKAQIMPLLPFASRYTPGFESRKIPTDGLWGDHFHCPGERMLVGVAGSARHEGLRGRVGKSVEPMPQYALLRHVVREGHVEWMLRGWRSLLTQLRGGQGSS